MTYQVLGLKFGHSPGWSQLHEEDSPEALFVCSRDVRRAEDMVLRSEYLQNVVSCTPSFQF